MYRGFRLCKRRVQRQWRRFSKNMQGKIKPQGSSSNDELNEMNKLQFLSPDEKSTTKNKFKISGLYESDAKGQETDKEFNQEAEEIIKNAVRRDSQSRNESVSSESLSNFSKDNN